MAFLENDAILTQFFSRSFYSQKESIKKIYNNKLYSYYYDGEVIMASPSRFARKHKICLMKLILKL